MTQTPLNLHTIITRLDIYFDVEFSFIKSEEAAALIVKQPRSTQEFILDLTRRVSATSEELAFQFACSAVKALSAMDKHLVETWAMTATDNYDQKGLFPAMTVIRELDHFVESARLNVCGAILEEKIPILLPFLQGLNGRKMKIATDKMAYTDSETIYLPPIIAIFETPKENFLVYKATIAMLWAQVHYGTFRFNFDELPETENPETENTALKLIQLSALETIRLEACIKRELPGLYRDMQTLKQKAAQRGKNTSVQDHLQATQWQTIRQRLDHKTATVADSLACLPQLATDDCPPVYCYQGILNPEKVKQVRQKRVEKEKALFRITLGELAKERNPHADEPQPLVPLKQKEAVEFSLQKNTQNGVIELMLEGELLPPPEIMHELATSITIDFGEIPPEYLYAAGPGEYDLKKHEDDKPDPDDVWKGTYHEEGAERYNEWDFKRNHYHKNWCVLRELEVKPEYDNFVATTLEKYKTLLKKLRHTFEIIRGEDKLLKRQVHGDDIDIDAVVEAFADVTSGMEMSERLFTKMHKHERNVAVIFMVDMSGSTKGWINDAEREALILLAEVLEILGDRYAIYGFSGMTRKRCELYRIKTFDEGYNDEIKARISNIQPQDYTRMGVFIRHATRMFSKIEASTKLMITLSDGKPDDYDTYRGEYGIEDTRQALYEAHRDGIHSFCITIDEQARDYLPHMYGVANYAVIDNVVQLPLKIADIYRRLTT